MPSFSMRWNLEVEKQRQFQDKKGEIHDDGLGLLSNTCTTCHWMTTLSPYDISDLVGVARSDIFCLENCYASVSRDFPAVKFCIFFIF